MAVPLLVSKVVKTATPSVNNKYCMRGWVNGDMGGVLMALRFALD